MIIRFLCAVHSFILTVPGEAETGSAGEQPDRGIAGAELIADDEKGVVLPTRSFAWARGRPAGGGSVPPRDLVFVVPHRTDRFRHALKTHTEAPQYCCGSCGGEGIVANSPGDGISPQAYRPGSCGEFPGKGRTLPSRHFFFADSLPAHRGDEMVLSCP